MLSIWYARPLPGHWSDSGTSFQLPKLHISHFPISQMDWMRCIEAQHCRWTPNPNLWRQNSIFRLLLVQNRRGRHLVEEIKTNSAHGCSSSKRHRTRPATGSNSCRKKEFMRAHWNVQEPPNVHNVSKQIKKVLRKLQHVLRHSLVVFKHQNHRKWNPKS